LKSLLFCQAQITVSILFFFSLFFTLQNLFTFLLNDYYPLLKEHF